MIETTDLEDIASQLLRHARASGADAADVVLVEGDSLMVGVRLGEIEKVSRARSKHLGLRAFVGQRSAITSTADFTPDSLAALAADTVALARVTAEDPFAGLASEADLEREIPPLDLYDPALAEITPEDATDLCRAAEAAAMAEDRRITNSEGAEFSSGTNHVVYASSAGFLGGYRSSHCTLSAVPVAAGDGNMERDYWYSSQRFFHRLEPPESIGRTAARRALRRLGARRVKTCEVPVVFDPETAASLLGHLAGAVSGSALYRGMSFLVGRLGERIFPDFVQISDDGRLPGGLASKPFDAEGVGTRRTRIVTDGVLTSYLFDSYSARKLASRSTGNASRSVADAPHPSPTNFFLHAGTATPEQIIASVRSGFYVTELLGMGVNPVTGDYSRGALGLWIENGELAYPVSEVTIAGKLLDMYRDIEMIGNDLVLRRGICAPTVKIARLTVAGE